MTMDIIEVHSSKNPTEERYYRVERKFSGIRTSAEVLQSLIRAHS